MEPPSSSASTKSTSKHDPNGILTAKQKEARVFLTGPQRHSCIYGGSRSGKTFLICRQVLARALNVEKSRHVILRARFNAVRASVWLDTLPKVASICWPGLERQMRDNNRDQFVQLFNGSQIWFGGLEEKDRVEKILGQEYSTMYFNECSQIPYHSIVVARTRLAQNVGLKPRAYYDLNPPGTGHWTNVMFGKKVDPESRRPLAEPEQYARLIMNPIDNVDHLPPGYIESELESLPERHRKRFLEGQYVSDVDGALWTSEVIEACRITSDERPELVRIVVAIDPSGTSGEDEKRSNEVGIVVAGLGVDGLIYVLDDLSCNMPPHGWATRAVHAFHRYNANAIVWESNFGGEMVANTIKTIDPMVPLIQVTASRGKAVRAEPVSSLYEKQRVKHVDRFARLEDQLLNFTTNGYIGEKSPDRADALVWAVTELGLGSASASPQLRRL
jgi:hypothetical protein